MKLSLQNCAGKPCNPPSKVWTTFLGSVVFQGFLTMIAAPTALPSSTMKSWCLGCSLWGLSYLTSTHFLDYLTWPPPPLSAKFIWCLSAYLGELLTPPPFPFCADVLYGSPHPPIKTRRNSLSQSFVSSLSHVNRWYRRQATRRSTWFFWAARRAPWRTRCTSTRRPAPSG